MISIVVPVYNMEKYLDRCICSILAQSFTDFELIIVNDGSTDNSNLIIEQYASQDKRIIVINQNNGGVASAKNTGIQSAIGEYITFVDSDDYIDIDYLSALIDNADSADLVIAGLKYLEKDGQKVYNQMNLQLFTGGY